MAVRILHTGDVHLGRMAGVGRKTAEHHQFIDRAFQRLLDIAVEQADVLLIVGDLIDRKPRFQAIEGAFVRRAVALLADAVARSPHLHVVLVAGNHDPPEVYERSEWRTLPERVHIAVQPELIEIEEHGLYVVALPWMDGAELKWSQWPQGPTVVAAHTCFPPPAQRSGDQCILREEEVADWPACYVALGHYHRWSEHLAGQVPAVMAGAPEIMDLGHTGVGRVYLVHVEGENPASYEAIETGQLMGLGVQEIVWQQVPHPRIEWLRRFIEDLAQKGHGKGLLRLRLTGVADRPLEPELEMLRTELSDNFFFLDIQNSTRAELDIEQLQSYETGLLRQLAEVVQQRLDAAEDEEQAGIIREAAALVWWRLRGSQE